MNYFKLIFSTFALQQMLQVWTDSNLNLHCLLIYRIVQLFSFLILLIVKVNQSKHYLWVYILKDNCASNSYTYPKIDMSQRFEQVIKITCEWLHYVLIYNICFFIRINLNKFNIVLHTAVHKILFLCYCQFLIQIQAILWPSVILEGTVK